MATVSPQDVDSWDGNKLRAWAREQGFSVAAQEVLAKIGSGRALRAIPEGRLSADFSPMEFVLLQRNLLVPLGVGPVLGSAASNRGLPSDDHSTDPFEGEFTPASVVSRALLEKCNMEQTRAWVAFVTGAKDGELDNFELTGDVLVDIRDESRGLLAACGLPSGYSRTVIRYVDSLPGQPSRAIPGDDGRHISTPPVELVEVTYTLDQVKRWTQAQVVNWMRESVGLDDADIPKCVWLTPRWIVDFWENPRGDPGYVAWMQSANRLPLTKRKNLEQALKMQDFRCVEERRQSVLDLARHNKPPHRKLTAYEVRATLLR